MPSALLESLLQPDDAASRGPAWLADARRAAADALAREGLPGARNEAWKYTSLRTLEQSRPVRDAEAATRPVDAALFALAIDASRLVFVNGTYRADLSKVATIAGASVATLGATAELEPWRALLSREYERVDTAFARLNTALAADGPLIRVAASARIETPIHLVFVGTGREIAWNARALIELGENASLRIVEHHVGTDAAAQLGNVVVQASLGAGARLDLIQIQDAAADATLIRRSELSLADGATLASHALEIGARLVRHDLDVDLRGRGARFVSRGVFALRGRQHADTHLDVRHDARDTASDIVWRGVADERALFYLRSRGLPLEAARHLLIAAFCAAALADVPRELRAHLEALLATRLPQPGVSP